MAAEMWGQANRNDKVTEQRSKTWVQNKKEKEEEENTVRMYFKLL